MIGAIARTLFGSAGGEMHICIPWTSLEPLREVLYSAMQADTHESDKRWFKQLQREVQNAEVELIVKLGHAAITLEQILNMQAGDVIGIDVPDTMLSVAVLVGDREEHPTDLVQLYARENGHRGRDAVLMRGGDEVARVADLPWEQEDAGHLARAAALNGRLMLAGKLAPENVKAAIEAVEPWAVDASSQLEISPGIKDHARIRAFVEAVRS